MNSRVSKSLKICYLWITVEWNYPILDKYISLKNMKVLIKKKSRICAAESISRCGGRQGSGCWMLVGWMVNKYSFTNPIQGWWATWVGGSSWLLSLPRLEKFSSEPLSRIIQALFYSVKRVSHNISDSVHVGTGIK